MTIEKLKPTDSEMQEHVLTLKNGIELGLGRQDPLIRIAVKAAEKYPHHLILLQAGSFLHAYDRSAYFLHKLKNYKLRIVGPENNPNIRCGLPVVGHKRSLWHVFSDYKVPYVVALGSRGNYKIHISHENITHSLIDDIPSDLVSRLIEELSQTDRLRTSRAVQILLKPEQVSFRLKQVADMLYHDLHQDMQRFPTSHRFFIGKDMGDCLSRIMRYIYGYSASDNRIPLLRQLSGDIDLLKSLLQLIHRIKLIDGSRFSLRASLAIEMGSLVGGLISKMHKTVSSQARGVRG